MGKYPVGPGWRTPKRVVIEWDKGEPTVLTGDDAAFAGHTVRAAFLGTRRAWETSIQDQVYPPDNPRDAMPERVATARDAFMGGVAFSVAPYPPVKDGDPPRIAILIGTPADPTGAIELHVDQQVIENALERHRRSAAEQDEHGPADKDGTVDGAAGKD